MTEYIFNKLKRLCEKPQIFLDAIEYWDFKPEREQAAIGRILSHFSLKGHIVEPKLILACLYGAERPILVFKVRGDSSEYLITGVQMEDDQIHIILSKNNRLNLN